jgi:hypothetical protein
MTERNVSLLFSGDLDNDHYDAPLPVEGKEVQNFRLSLFLKTAFAKPFSLDSGTA